MQLSDLTARKIQQDAWIVWKQDAFDVEPYKPLNRRNNRETLARVYTAFVFQLEEKGIPKARASALVRALWIEETGPNRSRSLPRIVGEDGFLRMYSIGAPLYVEHFMRIWKRLNEPLENITVELEPIYPEWNSSGIFFHDVDATPPGFLPKLFRYFRVKKDEELLVLISEDLHTISHLENSQKREMLTLAVLSHGAAYRELEGRILHLPHFSKKGEQIPYICHQHLIAEGVKTISLIPQISGATPIYLCQGTELWPSQPSVLGSILTNFAENGSATAAYAHSWRRIHKHLREMPGIPIVAGHSMGGALALQIGLYSHNLIKKVYAYNPPAPHERDYLFYHQLSRASQSKIEVITNLDDAVFWRIGSKLIGNITLFIGKIRWKYYSVGLWDCIFFLPAFVKFMLNVWHAFPAHQNITPLYESWIRVKLTQAEIDKENTERTTRFDYLHFLPKLYDPTKNLLTYIRKIFKWQHEKEYLRNEIELISLHERDLLDTINESNKAEIQHELKTLQTQKSLLISRLLRTIKL
jgi:hypothetical protein